MFYYYYHIRSILGKLLGRPSISPKKLQPEIVRLADVPAEYVYLKRVKCRSCGGSTSGSRHGAEYQNDATYRNGRFEGDDA